MCVCACDESMGMALRRRWGKSRTAAVDKYCEAYSHRLLALTLAQTVDWLFLLLFFLWLLPSAWLYRKFAASEAASLPVH